MADRPSEQDTAELGHAIYGKMGGRVPIHNCQQLAAICLLTGKEASTVRVSSLLVAALGEYRRHIGEEMAA